MIIQKFNFIIIDLKPKQDFKDHPNKINYYQSI